MEDKIRSKPEEQSEQSLKVFTRAQAVFVPDEAENPSHGIVVECLPVRHGDLDADGLPQGKDDVQVNAPVGGGGLQFPAAGVSGLTGIVAVSPGVGITLRRAAGAGRGGAWVCRRRVNRRYVCSIHGGIIARLCGGLSSEFCRFWYPRGNIFFWGEGG